MFDIRGTYFSYFRDLPPVVEPNRITGVGRFHKRGRQKAESYRKQKKKAASKQGEAAWKTLSPCP